MKEYKIVLGLETYDYSATRVLVVAGNNAEEAVVRAKGLILRDEPETVDVRLKDISVL